MRFLLSTFIFLSSSTLWSQIYLVCDASHIFYPDYEKRITFIFPSYESPTTTIVIEYNKFNNVFFENKTDFFIKPYEMFTSKYKINRETGQLTQYGLEKKISRQCKEYDSKSWDKENKKQEDWLTKQLKERKF